MARFSDAFLQELADRSEIVDVVSQYVRLTRRSGQNLFGLCPFHNEKTPSFSVAPDKQIYHCFGCGKGGSVFNFIMEIENLSFPDAVAFLARRAGMRMPEGEGDGSDGRRERLLALNRAAARFFYQALLAPGGATGRQYVLERQISPKVARAFGLGFAPDSFYALVNAMREQGFRDPELIEAGLANANHSGKGVHDIFRNRLMFPVIDVRGNVIGFSGRILGEGEPKYLNSRETPVFNKSRNLFALNLAKKSKSGYILLSEGNIDVVSLHQAGFDSAVASLGTSLTPEQARLIARYTGEVVIAYDNDAAGQKASQRAIGILDNLDLRVRVLQMSGAKDPDEFIKARGADAFRALIERSEDRNEFRLKRIAQKYDLQTSEGKVAYVREAAAMLAELNSPSEREVYAIRLAEEAGVSTGAVRDEVDRARARHQQSKKRGELRDSPRTLRESIQPKSRALRYENPRSAMAEEGLIRLMVLDPGLFDSLPEPVNPETFSSPLLGRFFTVLQEKHAANTPLSMAALSGSFSQEEMDHITSILQDRPESLSYGEQALADYIAIIHAERQAKLAEEQAASDPQSVLAFAQEQRNKKRFGG